MFVPPPPLIGSISQGRQRGEVPVERVGTVCLSIVGTAKNHMGDERMQIMDDRKWNTEMNGRAVLGYPRGPFSISRDQPLGATWYEPNQIKPIHGVPVFLMCGDSTGNEQSFPPSMVHGWDVGETRKRSALHSLTAASG